MKTGRIASWSIAALVLVGAVAILATADFSEKSTIMSKAFVFFVSAVIVVQVVPGIMLLGAMLKGALSVASKRVELPAWASKK